MLTSTPNRADAQFALAQSLWQQDEVVRCEAISRNLVACCPNREDASMLLAKLLRTQGRLDAASTVVLNLCRASNYESELSLRGASFIQQCQRQKLAGELCEAAIAHSGITPSLLVMSGNIAREIGDFQKARSRYLAALDASVDLNVWFVLGALAQITKYTEAGNPDFARFIEHFHNEAFTARSRAATGFGLAKAYDDVGDRELGALTLREANALVRSELGWESSVWTEFVESRKLEHVMRARYVDLTDFVPVFIVGLPRTGTTLAATRLAKYTGVRDRGELRVLRFIAEQLITGSHLGDPNAIEEAAQLYRVQTRQDDAPAAWYIDQDPLNFRYLHVIEAMFPQARIIVCHRDRRDTALSLWSQDFAHQDCAFAYDFASIANYAAGYDELMGYWRRTLSLPIHDVDYEAFVADQDRTLKALCDFIGASNMETEPQQIVAPINTASVWQARQQIYSTSVGRWRDYLPFVPELARFAADN